MNHDVSDAGPSEQRVAPNITAGPKPPADPVAPKPVPAAWFAAVALGAVGFDIALRRPPWNNLAGTLLFLALIAALLITGVVRTRNGRALLMVAAAFAVCLSWRSDPLLSTFNFFATIGLTAFAGFHGRGRSIWQWSPMQAIRDGLHFLIQGLETVFVEIPTQLVARLRGVRRIRQETAVNDSARAVVRGLGLALPILVVLGLLLASADAVFESVFSSLGFMDFSFNAWPLIGHLVLLAFGAVWTIAMLRIAATAPETEHQGRLFTVGSIESSIVLIGINVLFAIFAVTQIFTVLGGADAALERAGVDPKEFARQGFFQLLWVAALTLLVLMALQSTRDPEDGGTRRFRVLSLCVIAFTLLIVVVAFARLGFYIGEEGQTPLRFYSSVFSLWIALCLVFVSARILGWRSGTPWLTTALILAAATVGLVLNLVNPEAIMARDNLARDHEHLAYHLRPEHRQFSGEGWAVIADGLPELSGSLASAVEIQLCREYDNHTYNYNDGPLHFNLGKWRGEQALNDLCTSGAGLFD